MTCTLKEHYNKAHGLVYTTSEINKVCVKLPPGPLNTMPVTSPSESVTEGITETTTNTIDVPLITIPVTIKRISPVNLAK